MAHADEPPSDGALPQDVDRSPSQRREERKVLAGTMVGTTGAQMASWASLGISFLVRPLGAIAAEHVGDRYGRKVVLVLSLIHI